MVTRIFFPFNLTVFLIWFNSLSIITIVNMIIKWTRRELTHKRLQLTSLMGITVHEFIFLFLNVFV